MKTVSVNCIARPPKRIAYHDRLFAAMMLLCLLGGALVFSFLTWREGFPWWASLYVAVFFGWAAMHIGLLVLLAITREPETRKGGH